ncbi:MAG: hypothetical protein KJ626_12155, partial [Verrucomicrobia bacterium]|nr:hypothetical protein [Verrucomicrobiota bacterium]
MIYRLQKASAMGCIAGAAMCCAASFCFAVPYTMTFDSIAEGTAFARDEVYEESGIRLVSKSDYSSFSDGLNGMPTTPLYFHGTDQYVEFSLVSGGEFDLTSFELLSNGYVDRWIETSKTAGPVSIGQPTTLEIKEFSGAEYEGISWFRVGTSWYATQVDNITVEVLAGDPPDAFSLQLPEDGADEIALERGLRWTEAVGAVGYRLYWGTEADPPLYLSGISSTHTALPDLSEGSEYHWYVVATNAFGETRAPATGAWTLTADLLLRMGDLVMDFDGITEGTSFARDAVYEEDGIRVVCHSDNGTFSDSLNDFETTPLYFHGNGQYVEFSRTNGAPFDLRSFRFTSNGSNPRWLETSKTAAEVDIGMPTEATLLELEGEEYEDITWFRVIAAYAASYTATEVDDVTVGFVVTNAPGAFALSSPPTEQNVYSSSVVLDWTDAAGAETYELYLGETEPPAYHSTVTGESSSAISGLQNGEEYFWYVVASNQFGFSRAPESGSQSFHVISDVDTVITSDTIVQADDLTYENQSLVVDGCTLTINGHHALADLYLADGAIVRHAAATADEVYSIDLDIAGRLVIETGCSIDVAGMGYLNERGLGNEISVASQNGAGGSYGGFGG